MKGVQGAFIYVRTGLLTQSRISTKNEKKRMIKKKLWT